MVNVTLGLCVNVYILENYQQVFLLQPFFKNILKVKGRFNVYKPLFQISTYNFPQGK